MTGRSSGKDTQSLLSMAYQLYSSGDMAGAARIYNQILAIDPANSDSMLMMGIISFGAKKFDAAEKWVQSAIDATPIPNFMAYKVLGDVSRILGKNDAAISSFRKSLEINPAYAEASANLASLYLSQNDLASAEIYCRRALTLKPDYPVALYNLGLILEIKENFEEALPFYTKVVALKNDMAPAYAGIGRCLKRLQRHMEALPYFEKSVVLSPTADSYGHMGEILQENTEKLQKACEYYQAALKLAPDNIDYLNNLGAVYSRLKQFKNSQQCYKKIFDINPDHPSALNNMAIALKNFSQVDAAIDVYRHSLRVRPGHLKTISNMLFAMVYSSLTTPADIYQTAKQYGEFVDKGITNKYKFSNSRSENRKIRIGYVSPDFMHHSVNNFFEPLLTNHNRQKFEIFGYANVQVPDAVTLRIQSKFDHWRDIKGMRAEDAADLIHADNIDILIDMAGHTGDNSLSVFALKPAPVQVTWLGYPATTGLRQIDYRITDVYADPVGMTEQYNVEKLYRLPEIFACYTPREMSPDVTATAPFETNGYITFGCFNNFSKVSSDVLSLWLKILNQIPQARLMLEIAGLDDFREDLERRLSALGFPMDRVILETRKPENQFNLYNKIDIALDPFPCNGGTTSMDTMWMGVPLITLAGNNFVSRMGVTILTNVGLRDFIADSPDEYVQKAVELASDGELLRATRNNLREKAAASPLMDQKRFASNMEAAYIDMWNTWCREQPHE